MLAALAFSAASAPGLAAAGSPGMQAAAAAGAASPPAAHGPRARLAARPAVKPVDLNRASRAELKTLPFIGDAEADRIIAARPFLGKAQLVTRHVIPVGPYLALKDRVVAMRRIDPKDVAKAQP